MTKSAVTCRGIRRIELITKRSTGQVRESSSGPIRFNGDYEPWRLAGAAELNPIGHRTESKVVNHSGYTV